MTQLSCTPLLDRGFIYRVKFLEIKILGKYKGLSTPSYYQKLELYERFTRYIRPWLKIQVLEICALAIKSSN